MPKRYLYLGVMIIILLSGCSHQAVVLYYVDTEHFQLIAYEKEEQLSRSLENRAHEIFALLKEPPLSALYSVVPEDVVLLHAEVDGRRLYLDISPQIMHIPGSFAEGMFLQGVLRTYFGLFPKIEEIQFFVEGTAVDSFGGHIEVSTPFEREQFYQGLH